jgi:hypothetical protein
MREETSAEPMSVHRDGTDVVLALSAPAARRLADAVADLDGDHAGWLHDLAGLLVAAANEHDSSQTNAAEASHTVLLRGNWSSDDDLDGPLPFTEAHPLETIGPGLVGTWRTQLTGKRGAEKSADEDEVDASQVDAAARLVDAVAAAKLETSKAASANAVESRMRGARAALGARVGAAPVESQQTPGDQTAEEQVSGRGVRHVPSTRNA